MKPNILIVVGDSLRARNIGVYGHYRNTSPYFDKLAEESILYKSAWSPAVWTLPSHVSMFTGYEVPEHRVQSHQDAINPEEVVFKQLSNDGYSTAILSENAWLTEAEMGIRSAFDTVVGKPSILYPEALQPGEFAHQNEYGDYLGYLKAALQSNYPLRSIVNGIVAKVQYDFPKIGRHFLPETDGHYFVNEFINWDSRQSGPWAAAINLMDPHRPYVPASEYDRWDDGTARQIQNSIDDPAWDFLEEKEPSWKLRALESLYDGGIRQFDDCLEHIVTYLKKTGEFDDTLLIVVGDHGEAFGEYSRFRDRIAVEHKEGLHHVQTHVPLLVNPPQERSRNVEAPVSITETARVVKEVIDGKDVDFIRDRPVITVYDDISNDLVSEEVLATQKIGLESLINMVDGTIIKHSRYEGSPETVVSEIMHGTQCSSLVCRDTDMDPNFDSVIAELEFDQNVQSHSEIDEVASERLDALGYL